MSCIVVSSSSIAHSRGKSWVGKGKESRQNYRSMPTISFQTGSPYTKDTQTGSCFQKPHHALRKLEWYMLWKQGGKRKEAKWKCEHWWLCSGGKSKSLHAPLHYCSHTTQENIDYQMVSFRLLHTWHHISAHERCRYVKMGFHLQLQLMWN